MEFLYYYYYYSFWPKRNFIKENQQVTTELTQAHLRGPKQQLTFTYGI